VTVQITVTIPNGLAALLLPDGQEPARVALEALALDAYRQRRITAFQLRTLLSLPSRYELDGFLKRHEVYDYTIEDLDRDLATVRYLNERRDDERPA
jgi:hypothetical protein